MHELSTFDGILLPYQKRWLTDKRRFKIALKSRQIGWTKFCGTLSATTKALRGEPNYYLSTGERQSKEAIADVITHARAFQLGLEAIEGIERIDDRDWKVLEVKFPGGGKVVGLPANPSTIRGSRGNMFFDEYAFHKDSRGIWRAAGAIAAHGWTVEIFSSPNGRDNDFYEKWTTVDAAQWSRHQVDIHQAIREGLPLDLEELRALYPLEDDWVQEFELGFLDAAINWITNDLLDAADDAGAWLSPPDGWAPVGPLYLGVDIGRTRDLTVLWLTEEIFGTRWTRAVVPLEKMRFRAQRERIDELMGLGVRKACVDQTGLGMQLAEELAEDYGEDRVEKVTFTATEKARMAKDLKASMEDHLWRIPVDLEIRRDFRKVKRLISSTGNEIFHADRSEKDGHADHFWACALSEKALRAGGYVRPVVDVIEKSASRRTDGERWRDRPTTDIGDERDDWRREVWS